MKLFGQSAALLAFAALAFGLAIAHPMTYLQARHVALDGQEFETAVTRYVESYAESDALRTALKGEDTIGYVSEAPIDVRVGGPLQARYYLSQFALAPLLLELDGIEGRTKRSFVLANFPSASELDAYLSDNHRQVVVSISEGIALTKERKGE